MADHIQWLYSYSNSNTIPFYFKTALGWVMTAKKVQIYTINHWWFTSQGKDM